MPIESAAAQSLSDLLAAVGEPTRIAVLTALRDGPSAVAPLAERLGAVMVNVSHHLNVLRRAGLLTSRKEGRQVIYALNPDLLAESDGAVGKVCVAGWEMTLGSAAGKRRRAAQIPVAEAV